MAIREKKHRLSLDNYIGFNIVSFTFCIFGRKYFFIDDLPFNIFEGILLNELKQYNCQAHVYLFMPDHGHFIFQGKQEDADIWKCMVEFKQKTGYWLSKNASDFEWQKDFYDHILRKDEDIKKHIEYVLYNPVRKGLVRHWKAYPYKGSTLYDLDAWD
jgi:putative transposase